MVLQDVVIQVQKEANKSNQTLCCRLPVDACRARLAQTKRLHCEPGALNRTSTLPGHTMRRVYVVNFSDEFQSSLSTVSTEGREGRLLMDLN